MMTVREGVSVFTFGTKCTKEIIGISSSALSEVKIGEIDLKLKEKLFKSKIVSH